MKHHVDVSGYRVAYMYMYVEHAKYTAHLLPGSLKPRGLLCTYREKLMDPHTSLSLGTFTCQGYIELPKAVYT